MCFLSKSVWNHCSDIGVELERGRGSFRCAYGQAQEQRGRDKASSEHAQVNTSAKIFLAGITYEYSTILDSTEQCESP